MSDAEVRAQYNQAAENTQLGLEWWSNELVRRAVNRQTETLIRLTQNLIRLTWVIAVLGIAGVLLALFK